MTAQQPLRDLIARLESAEKGSRELDRKIGIGGLGDRELGMDNSIRVIARGGIREQGRWPVDGSWELAGRIFSIPHYTTSIDAALTLVPDGMLWQVGTVEGEAEVWWEGEPSYYTNKAVGESYAADGDTFNAALALCIAALKARLAND